MSDRRLSPDEYFLQLLKLVSSRSTCVRRSVGAIITDERRRVLAMGYNGVPQKFPHCELFSLCPGAEDPSGDTRRCMAVHAEVNAILQCSRLDLARTIYVSCSPCFACAKMLCNTAIRRVVCLEPYADEGAEVLKSAGIRIVIADQLKEDEANGL